MTPLGLGLWLFSIASGAVLVWFIVRFVKRLTGNHAKEEIQKNHEHLQ